MKQNHWTMIDVQKGGFGTLSIRSIQLGFTWINLIGHTFKIRSVDILRSSRYLEDESNALICTIGLASEIESMKSLS